MKKILLFLLVSVMVLGCFMTVSAKEATTIAVLEDAYVINANGDGDQSNNNFGADKEIHLKTAGSSLTRYGYVKFDVSSLVGVNDYTCIDLELTLSSRQNDPGNPPMAVIEVYGAATDWTEGSITFNDQPEKLGPITVNKNVGTEEKAYTFSVTDYVRQAIAKGEKSVAFYLVEATAETPLHTRFHSKENGDAAKAPKLTVHYGTKTDSQTYGGIPEEIPYQYIPSKNGIETFIGKEGKVYDIRVKEDTYVEGGNNAYTNYGKEKIIDFKAKANIEGTLHRISLFKFDISKIKTKVTRAVFSINCTIMQDASIPTLVDVYGCDPYEWDEKTVTYIDRPEREEYITSLDVKKLGVVSIDITDYLNKAVANGEKVIALMLEGDETEPLRLNFQSREAEDAYVPIITVWEGDLNFTTNVVYEGENPWDVAAERVSEWFNRWEVIKARGDMEVDTVVKDNSEYSIVVDATSAGKTNGYETKYSQYPTRTISTLKDFTADKSEVQLYDVYGGLMDESMKQEATGFFYTKKIDDRWWTIDPLGYPFYRTACVLVSSGGSSKQQNAVKSVYGTYEAWAVAATDRLQELGFNSTGGWSDIARLSKVENPLAQTTILYVLATYTTQAKLNLESHGSTEMEGNMLPVFDPAFEASAKNTVKSKVAGYQDMSSIYGWMSDNELPDEKSMLDSVLAFDATDPRLVYSYATAWTFMYLKTGKEDVSIYDVTDELRQEFRAMVYDRYFYVVADALERYDPVHQYMGCRFLMGCAKDEMVMRVAGHYCDVISLNYYGVWEGNTELMANMERWSGKSFIVTEWYAKGMDVWEADNRMTNQSGAGFTVRTQNDRGLFYQNYALMLMECKGCVGFDWFQYWDNDPDNLSADSSNRNANKGIYDNNFKEYTVLTNYMEELNNQKHHIISYFDAR